MTLDQARARLKQIKRELREILDRAKAANRDLSDVEVKDWNEKKAEGERLSAFIDSEIDALQRAHAREEGGSMPRNVREVQSEIDEIRSDAQLGALTPYLERRLRALEQELDGASTRTRPPPREAPDPMAGRAPAAHVRENRPYSLLAFLRADSSKDWRDAKVELRAHDELRERYGDPHDERSKRIPYRALLPMKRQAELERRDVDSTGAGSLIAQDLAADDFIELLRNEAMVVRAGARMLPNLVGNVDVPRQSAAATGAWIATETGSPAEGQLTTDKITLAPKTFAVRTEITRKMLKQATPWAEDLVREDIRRQIGLGIDLAAISGSGASGQPTGITVISGTGTVTHGGALTANWANILEYESDLGAANAPTDRRAFLMRSAARAALKATVKVTGQASFLMEPDGTINGYPVFVTEQAPASGSAGALLYGSFGEVLIGMWGVLDLFSDPYTLGNSGGLVVRGFQDIDIGIRHAASFSRSTVF